MNERRKLFIYPDNYAMCELLVKRPDLVDLTIMARLRSIALESA